MSAEPDVVNLLSSLIRYDTQNFGGGRSRGETPCAEFIAGLLRDAGYEPQLWHRPDSPDRANVVLRLPGRDSELEGLVVQGHLDVVPVEADEWSVDPFGGVVRDGYVYGRGAADMKDMCSSMLATLLQWAREDAGPRRDLVFAFVADEEDAGQWGAEWLVAEHPELFAGCAAAVGEDGGVCTPMRAADGSIVRLYPISCAERGTMHVRLTARGASGHASRPSGDDAVRRLLDALHRLTHHDWPLRLSDVVAAQLVALADPLGYEVDLDDEASIAALVDALGEDAGPLRFTTRVSSTPTMLSAGSKVNVVPGVATAEVDVRCPPGAVDETDAMLAELIGDKVEWEYSSRQDPVSSPVGGPWYDALCAAVRAADPEGVPFPNCMGGGTDAKAFAKLGMATYGFTPLGPDPDGRRFAGVHGVDERVPLESLRWGQRVLRDFLERV
ncbi:M20/M25/M40 family metallo-hydrolase [Nigerium massiliense]|uniref:M20/M25/M40 family metallo-hydrolase n=1 Tax=Nigerium massiliense TaxID=1522317 RepID=UPI00058C7BAF|nr:M20/M25/M40 family metallo-hydrolase [Nigerium massiliense]